MGYWINFFPDSTNTEIESDSDVAGVAIIGFIKLHWLGCYLILGTSTVKDSVNYDLYFIKCCKSKSCWMCQV